MGTYTPFRLLGTFCWVRTEIKEQLTHSFTCLFVFQIITHTMDPTDKEKAEMSIDKLEVAEKETKSILAELKKFAAVPVILL